MDSFTCASAPAPHSYDVNGTMNYTKQQIKEIIEADTLAYSERSGC